MPEQNSISAIPSLVFGLLGGCAATALSYLLNRGKTAAEIQKLRAETEKIRAEIKTVSNAAEYSLSESTEEILFDGRPGIDGFDIKGEAAQFWHADGTKAKVRGEGTLRFDGGVLDLQRTNTDERFELWLQRYMYNGSEHSEIPSDDLISGKRKLRIGCEARAVGAIHALRFIVKEVSSGKWLADEKVQVKSGDWTKIQVFLTVPPASKVRIRIDDEGVSQAPSSVQLRNLVVAQRKSAGATAG